MKHLTLYISILIFTLTSCDNTSEVLPPLTETVSQVPIPRVNEMPDMPAPYMMKNWRKTAIDFDHYIYDFNQKGKFLPFIWIDSMKRNFPQNTFGLFTAVGDVREGPDVNDGENHEAIGALGSIIGATLVGIDKSSQNGMNFVEMTKNYFNRDNGWNIIMNFTSKKAHIGGGYGNDFWYDIYNNVLFYGMANYYPKVKGIDSLQRIIADQFLTSANILKDDYTFSFFNFKDMYGGVNHIPTQEDVAAGYAFILYAAYIKYKDKKYLDGAEMALTALQKQKENRNYELFMPFGAYLAARLNAEEGRNYDVLKFLNWTFEGKSVNRDGWGVITGNWNGYDVSGLYGSTKDKGGYGFAMNTFDLAWPLLPMVRYDQRYAAAIAKWMLNAANASRLFYPYNIPDSLQALPAKKAITKNVIAYEGLVRHPTIKGFENRSPFAQGDGPLWAPGMPDETMFSIYGSGHVGFFGGTIHTTDKEGILFLDCLATDMYRKEKAYPTYLVYNPGNTAESVKLPAITGDYALYDAVSQKLLSNGDYENDVLNIRPKQTALLIFVPSASRFKVIDQKLYADDVVIDFHYHVGK
ncbi:MAG: hypothetical protein J5I59_13450 [Saprospiraceae bacterium]|nr:hypothetical protein [Saprospiraceae bacterium]